MIAPETKPLILAACLDQPSYGYFDALRKTHFPLARNAIGAHLTLFHHLPGNDAERLINDIRSASASEQPMPLEFAGIMKLGRGVAFRFDSPQLEELRKRLAERWMGRLTSQDRAAFRPHITIQNKVVPETANELAASLEASPLSIMLEIQGLTLWRYLGGPWAHVQTVPFGQSFVLDENCEPGASSRDVR